MPQADPQAVPDIARRVAALQAAGHGWLEPQSQVALAAAPTSDQTMVAQASSFRQALNQTAAQSGTSLLGSVGSFFGDPVLQKQPSAALALRSYLLQKQGWMPIAEGDLRSIQQKLVDDGYLGQADVNGVWTPASQQAYYKATSDHIEQQQTHSGGFSIGHALAAFLPSHWIPALVGAAKAFPGELRDMVSSVAGDWAGMVDTLAHPSTVDLSKLFTGGSAQGQQFAAGVQRDVRSGLGDPNAAAKTDSPYSVHDQINNINVALTLMPVIRAGKLAYAGFDAARAAGANVAVNDAAGTGFFRGMTTDLGKEAAQRGPGTVSKLLYNSDGGGILRNRLFEQSPVARFIAPPVRAVFSPDGKTLTHAYYMARTAAASGYRYAGGQAVGAAYANARMAGLSEEAINAVESKLGAKHTALGDQIHAEGTISGPFGIALDLLDGGFHGPINTSATLRAAQEGRNVLLPVSLNPSHSVTALVQHASDYMDAAMKPLNVGWAVAEGSKLGNKATSVEEQIAKYGEPFVQSYWNGKINKYAAAAHATDALKTSGLSPDSEEYQRAFQAASHEALNDPALLRPARDTLLSNMVDLHNKVAQDANKINREMEDEFRQGMDAYHQAWAPATALFTRHAHELQSPQGLAALGDARKQHEFLSQLGQAEGAAPVGDSQFFAANPAATGSFGLARKRLPGQPEEVETQTEPLMRDKAKALQARLDAAGSPVHDAEDIGTTPAYNPDAVAAVKKDALNYLVTFRGKNPTELAGLNAQHLIDAIHEAAAHAPKDVTPALDATPETHALIQQIGDAGFKVVAGTDIGHEFVPPMLDPVLIDGYKSKLRKLATIMGVQTIPVSTEQAGTIRRLLTERELQHGINKGLIRVQPGVNGARLHTFILNNMEARTDLTPGEKAAYAVGEMFGTHDRAARAFLGADATPADIKAWKDREQNMMALGNQPIEVAPKQIVKALTVESPQVFKDLTGETGTVPFMDVKSANTAADSFVRAMIHEPAWAFGAGKIEDVMRAGFGFLGSRASESSGVLRRLSRLPNASIRARNRYRFQLDPMFSMKRVAKTALKASIPGDHGVSAPLTVRPLGHMADQGILNEAFDTLNRVLPMKSALGYDTNDRLLYENDAFGIYNPRHHMALRAYHLAKAGLSDPEIAADLKRTFTYGDRTALERTLGTVWYPFSFEKTLWRNVGSYMLDHPGARLASTVAYDAYAALSQHAGIDQWLKDHAPILNEFKKMNAFEHGIGPGQVGGINAMYAPALWNLFGPQRYGAMKDPTTNALQNIFPVLRELNSLLVGYSPTTGTMPGGRPNGSLVQQAGIGLWATQHAVDRATTAIGLGHAADSPFNLIGKAVPLRDETVSAEQNKAWAYRNSLIMSLAPVLDFNYHNRGGERVWGSAAPANVQGKPINRSTIDEIVHDRYASYDPSVAQSLAVTKKTAMERYVADLTQSDPQRAAAYQQFMVPAEKLRPILQRAVTDPAKYGQLATVEQVFRDLAINMAEQDPKFVAFYNHFYLTEFGPIEAIQ